MGWAQKVQKLNFFGPVTRYQTPPDGDPYTGDTHQTDDTDHTDKRKRGLRWWKREDMDKIYVTRMGRRWTLIK